VCREPLHKWLGNLFGASVRIECFDKDAVRLFVQGAMASIFCGDRHPMSTEVRQSFRTLATRILRDAESNDEEDTP
jgi:hypothetical protein